MTNTQKRVISALFLAALVLVALFMGPEYCLGLMLVAGTIVVDEIQTNIFKRKERFNLNYFLTLLFFVLPFVYLNFVDFAPALIEMSVNGALVLNVLMLIYLFFVDFNSKLVNILPEKVPFFAAIFVLLPMLSLGSIFHYEKWMELLIVLLVVNFGMDTGAWFFGKNFGKRKLWPKVSPNKTIEGFIGGVVSSGILGAFVWRMAFGNIMLSQVIVFAIFGLLSQLGDLFQSKVKRQVDIKDSSSLIPGHGGVYDRLDSLLFLSPFYSAILKYYYFQ